MSTQNRRTDSRSKNVTRERKAAKRRKWLGMEQLEARPYTKLTTRETLVLQKDENLGKNLKNIDHAIYGYSSPVLDSFHYLRSVADARFNKKLQEVKHGK